MTDAEILSLIFKKLAEFDPHNKCETALERAEEAARQMDNYLTFGQGGASFQDSQLIDKLYDADMRAEIAEDKLKRIQQVLGNRYE